MWYLRWIIWAPDGTMGDTKSAKGPMSRRESVLAIDIKRTSVAVAASADGVEEYDGRERAIVPILDITISLLPTSNQPHLMIQIQKTHGTQYHEHDEHQSPEVVVFEKSDGRNILDRGNRGDVNLNLSSIIAFSL